MASTAAQPLCGRFSDIFGRKLVPPYPAFQNFSELNFNLTQSRPSRSCLNVCSVLDSMRRGADHASAYVRFATRHTLVLLILTSQTIRTAFSGHSRESLAGASLLW